MQKWKNVLKQKKRKTRSRKDRKKETYKRTTSGCRQHNTMIVMTMMMMIIFRVPFFGWMAIARAPSLDPFTARKNNMNLSMIPGDVGVWWCWWRLRKTCRNCHFSLYCCWWRCCLEYCSLLYVYISHTHLTAEKNASYTPECITATLRYYFDFFLYFLYIL